jgi:hypothetical protein
MLLLHDLSLDIWFQTFLVFKKKKSARCQWLMPVILATQEAEIRRILV